jgi:hypothetical protein
MVAFDAAGNVRWIVPNDWPAIATADGGVIGTSGITYDANGNATGRVTLATQSWRGNQYRDGPVEELALTQVDAAMSLWAFALFGGGGANQSGNNTAARPWYFKLVWQNNCATVPWPCGFVLYPDNPRALDGLAVDATSQATAIKNAALSALKKAYEGYNVDVSEGRTGTGDHQVNVIDGYSLASPCGQTQNYPSITFSDVFYLAAMENAQWALGIVLKTPQDVQNALGSMRLMDAIGAGIGNNAAHELAHQFLLKKYGMDDSSTNTYNGADCNGATAPWVYGIGPINWEGVAAGALKNSLGTGYHE